MATLFAEPKLELETAEALVANDVQSLSLEQNSDNKYDVSAESYPKALEDFIKVLAENVALMNEYTYTRKPLSDNKLDEKSVSYNETLKINKKAGNAVILNEVKKYWKGLLEFATDDDIETIHIGLRNKAIELKRIILTRNQNLKLSDINLDLLLINSIYQVIFDNDVEEVILPIDATQSEIEVYKLNQQVYKVQTRAFIDEYNQMSNELELESESSSSFSRISTRQLEDYRDWAKKYTPDLFREA